MSGTGINYKDLVPLPEKTEAVTDPDKEEKSHTITEEPTASHALAMADHEVKGAAQLDHGNEVRDLGWNEPDSKIPSPLVGGMDNEELWLLVRRFNMQMYHVKETTKPVPGNLDLNIADEDEFSPDKLRSVIERLYLTVILSLIGVGKHIVRLRSWRETRRTAAFAGAYFVAWLLDMIAPLIVGMFIALIAIPKSRNILFPPAPLALVGKDGAPTKPKAGVLGSHDTVTGAPENYKGEAAEAEATNFVNSIANVAISSAAGKHPMGDTEENTPDDAAPDPTALTTSAANARANAAGNKTHDKTKAPMENAMWSKMRPAMHILQDVVDTWERFGNALDPTPPFPQEGFRLRLAGLLVPILAISLVTTNYMVVKATGAIVGFAFFSDPLMQKGIKLLNEKVPNWPALLEPRNTILKGVPTNAQLTITLLRVGEANKAPLPPPPYSHEAPPDEVAHTTDDHLAGAGADAPLGADEHELRAAMAHDPSVPHQTGGSDIDAAKHTSHGKKGGKLIGFFRSTVKGGVESALGVDHARAAAGSGAAKQRLGVVSRNLRNDESGPVDFSSRYNGKKGHVYISAKATIPCVSFSTDSSIEKIGSQDREDLHPAWSIAIADIKELKKIGGFGWKAKLVVGWALNREVADGLEIVDRKGSVWRVTAIPLRNELFNRLVAMGGQKWEAW